MISHNYLDGDVFYYRGRPLTLRISPPPPEAGAGNVRVSADGMEILISSAGPADGAEGAERAKRAEKLLWWYTSETWNIVRGLLPVWCKRMGVRPTVTNVKYAKTRWGSCSARGALLFNSRLAMLSDDIAEYVVVHELCHLVQMNHSPAFWHEVGGILPDYKSLRARLREEEKRAWL